MPTSCDLPPKTFKSMLDFISDEIRPDIVFWTGDNSSHDIWRNTSDESIDYSMLATDMIKEAFKGQDVAIYPSLGNHDTWFETT